MIKYHNNKPIKIFKNYQLIAESLYLISLSSKMCYFRETVATNNTHMSKVEEFFNSDIRHTA